MPHTERSGIGLALNELTTRARVDTRVCMRVSLSPKGGPPSADFLVDDLSVGVRHTGNNFAVISR